MLLYFPVYVQFFVASLKAGILKKSRPRQNAAGGMVQQRSRSCFDDGVVTVLRLFQQDGAEIFSEFLPIVRRFPISHVRRRHAFRHRCPNA